MIRNLGNVRISVVLLTCYFLSLVSLPGQEPYPDSLRQEEAYDYYQKWLKEDVVYIISDEERAVFEDLSVEEEKEQFIEQFWFRRDPDPGSAENEFKLEHYRRIAYANERFTSGYPGWKTDRGRVYIIHGPPDEIEARPMGGHYQRTFEEGGGTTSVYPYEKWTYLNIEGLGQNIEVEFVDKTGSGQYKLAVFNWEKDELLQMPTAETEAEIAGYATRADHPGITPQAGTGSGIYSRYYGANDSLFQKYEQDALIGSTPIVKYKELREQVEVFIEYSNLPISVKEHYLRLNDDQDLVVVNIQIENKNLFFETQKDQKVAQLAVFGLVRGLSGRIVSEFEDDLIVRYPINETLEISAGSALYQKILPLDQGQRYKLDLVVKDLKSGQVGVMKSAISPPFYNGKALIGSSIILSDEIKLLGEAPDQKEMFVLGDIQIRPKIGQPFTSGTLLGIYLQIYNAEIDQQTLRPSLEVVYSVLRDGQLLGIVTDLSGNSIQYFSRHRVVLLTQLDLRTLSPGDYQLEVEVVDILKNERITERSSFKVVGG